MTTMATYGDRRGSILRNARTIAFTALALFFALGSFIMLEGLTEGLMPWIIVGCPGCGPDAVTTTEIHRWHGAEHGATVGWLFGGALLLLLRRAASKPLLLQFYALGHAILPLFYGLLPPAYVTAEGSIFLSAMMLGTTGLLVAAYPAAREVFSLKGMRPSRPLLLLGLAAAAVLLPMAGYNVTLQLAGVGGEHAIHARWTGAAVICVLLALGGLMAATRRAGWKPLGLLVGSAYLYLGAAAITVPDQAGSWGIAGGLLSLAFGATFIAAVLRESRKA